MVTRVILHFNNGDALIGELGPAGGNIGEPPADVPAPGPVGPTSPAVTSKEPPVGSALQPDANDGDQPALFETMPIPPPGDDAQVQDVLIKTPPSQEASMSFEDAPVIHATTLEEEEGECWILMHMEKSRGGAVRQIASDFWRKEELVFDTVQWRRGDSYAEYVMSSHWKLMHGGCVETLRNTEEEEGARPCKWLTVFRHPVARLLSAYDHCREAPQDPLCPPTKSKDLAAFAERWGNFAMRQFALASVSQSAVKEWAARDQVSRGVSVWYLVKEYLTRDGGAEDAVLEGLLQPVKDLLSTQYAAVGIATELDATMRLFEKALSVEGLGWVSSWSMLRMHHIEHDFEYDIIKSAAFRDALANPRIASALRLDVLLYDHALSVFQKQILRYGVSVAAPK